MLRRPKTTEEFGSDSFMDIVANVVGILIILVIAVGIRASKAPPTDALADAGPSPEMLRLADSAKSLELETSRLSSEASALRADLADRLAKHQEMSALVAQYEAEISQRSGALASQAAHESDLKTRSMAAQAYLAQLEDELAQIGATRPEPVEIACYPTPISRTVEGKEAHFQLKGGRVVFIPVDELLSRLKADALQQVYKLRDATETTDTVGPLGGFRMRYRMERVDATADDMVAGGRSGSYAQLGEWTLVPVSGQMGETLEEALADGSEFRAALARHNRERVTITMWTYADSFPEFRSLKKELYTLGYATAARPMPEGQPIGGSPNGSKSAAQ
jgi:hypothetical protein